MEHYTSEAWVHYLATQAISSGVDKSTIFKLTKIKTNTLTQSSLLNVPVDKSYALLGLLHDCGYQKLKELPLTINYKIPMLSSEVDGAYLYNSPNVKTFISRFKNIFEQHNTSMKHEFEIGAHTTKIYIDFIDSKAVYYVIQAYFLIFSSFLYNIFNLNEQLKQQIVIGITQQSIPDYTTFCKHVTDRVHTRKSRAYIQIPSILMEMKNPTFNPLLNQFIITEHNKYYGKNEGHDALITNIINQISEQWICNAESTTIEKIAQGVGMSRSKLYRELTQRNITFSEILESQRKKFALEQIKNRDINIAEISDRLGYANVSAFTRAFNRWFNTNPSKMRQ